MGIHGNYNYTIDNWLTIVKPYFIPMNFSSPKLTGPISHHHMVRPKQHEGLPCLTCPIPMCWRLFQKPYAICLLGIQKKIHLKIS